MLKYLILAIAAGVFLALTLDTATRPIAAADARIAENYLRG